MNADDKVDGRRSWTSGRYAHLCSRSVVYFFVFFLFLSVSFLAHCHIGASRYNVSAARFDAWQADNIYGIWICGILLHADRGRAREYASASTHDSRYAAINM